MIKIEKTGIKNIDSSVFNLVQKIWQYKNIDNALDILEEMQIEDKLKNEIENANIDVLIPFIKAIEKTHYGYQECYKEQLLKQFGKHFIWRVVASQIVISFIFEKDFDFTTDWTI